MLQKLPRLIAAVVLTIALMITFSAFGSTSAQAAATTSASASVPSTTIILWSQCGSSDCYGSIGTTYRFSAHWNSGPWGSLVLTAMWGDGGSDGYVCGFNCGSGWAFFNHFYNNSGTFNTWCNGGNTNHVYMHIS